MTAPDFYSFRKAGQSFTESRAAIDDACSKLRQQGATWLRVTAVDASHQALGQHKQGPFGFWIEGWRERPAQEGPFNPPLIVASGEPR